MSTESKIITTVVIFLVLIGGFYFLAPDSMKFWGDQTANVIDSDNDDSDTAIPAHERITAKHQYKDGNHIIAGEVNMPTPCYILNVSARVAGEQVTLDFVSETNGDVCAEVITTERFKVDFSAGENAVIKATWNGQPVELNLIPAGANEDLVNFEIFVK